ncbi:MAG: bifunctional ornithine acetyltransferase/N-acetylglutamate synthase, partial [Thermus sp.]|uniref:bifunctional ornithine acetyltransferase/N-acetylglutamate synthase n=1 Tax=Thermus sp. TaxID=275 RepID=UPI0030ACCF8C
MAVTLPRGFRMGAVRAGIKPSGKPDLALLASGLPALWAYAATQNRAAAPSVHRGRRLYAEGRPLRAVVVNAGNANCATGERGFRDDERLAELAAFRLGLSPEEVLTASTGVIGVPLPVEKVEKALPQLELGPFADPFAEAILTTDLAVKVAEREVEGARLVGVAKGSGMIHPNMATMLAFLVTDARVPQGVLRERWKGIVDRTFNQVTVDGDTSTNDLA